MASDEIDDLNWRPPPTSGLATRRFRGTDPAEMLRRVADYIDRENPGRTIVALWCVPPSDGSQGGMEFDVIIEHDEDAYTDLIEHDGDVIEVEGLGEMLAGLRGQPGLWRHMATVDDAATAVVLRDAFREAAREHLEKRDAPTLEGFSFEWRQPDIGAFCVYGRYESPPSNGPQGRQG